MKIDLLKSYDKVNYLYFKLLLQLGMNLKTINWIMGFLSSYLDVLINVSPLGFFNASRRLHQLICPLSPFLFILVVEGLSMLIKYARKRGVMKGIKVSKVLAISRLCFVDKIMIFGQGSIKELRITKNILNMCFLATSLEVNMVQSSMLSNELEEEVTTQMLTMLPMKHLDIKQGIKYLGFKLKPNDYGYAY